MDLDSELDCRNADFDLTTYLYSDSTEDELELERNGIQHLETPLVDHVTDMKDKESKLVEGPEVKVTFNPPPNIFNNQNILENKFLELISKKINNNPKKNQTKQISPDQSSMKNKGKGKVRFSCVVCRKKFSDKRFMKAHVREVHFKPQVICSVCGCRVAMVNIEKHKEKVHNVIGSNFQNN